MHSIRWAELYEGISVPENGAPDPVSSAFFCTFIVVCFHDFCVFTSGEQHGVQRERQRDRETERQIERERDRQAGRQTDRQTESGRRRE